METRRANSPGCSRRCTNWSATSCAAVSPKATSAPDLDVDTTAAIVMQTALGALRLRGLGAELNGVPIDGGHLYEFCLRGLSALTTPSDLRNHCPSALPGVVFSLVQTW